MMQINDRPYEEDTPHTVDFESDEMADIVKFMNAVGRILAILTAVFFILTVVAQLYILVHRL
jgi:hypothetical protein